MKIRWEASDDRDRGSHCVIAYREDMPDHPVAEVHMDPEHWRPYFIKTIKVTKKTTYTNNVRTAVLAIEDPVRRGEYETLEEAKKEAEDAIAVMYEEERPGYTYGHGDLYGYIPYYFDANGKPTCYYIEGKDGEMLIGDGLPSTEKEAREYCRIANIAYRHGLEKGKAPK